MAEAYLVVGVHIDGREFQKVLRESYNLVVDEEALTARRLTDGEGCERYWIKSCNGKGLDDVCVGEIIACTQGTHVPSLRPFVIEDAVKRVREDFGEDTRVYIILDNP